MKILNILSDKIEMENLFIPDMCELLEIYSYPFFKERSSDEINFSTVISECMANLGFIFMIFTFLNLSLYLTFLNFNN
jgi:hypothetical protein